MGLKNKRQPPKSALIVNLGGWADTVQTSFVAPALKDRYPSIAITYLMRERLADWAPCLPADRFLFVKNHLGIWSKIRKSFYDLALDLTGKSGLNRLAENGIFPASLSHKLNLRQAVNDSVLDRLFSRDISPRKYIVCAPGSTGFGKAFYNGRWTYLAELLNLLIEKTNYSVVILGSQKDLAWMTNPLPHRRVVSWVGETTREEALGVLSHAAAYIGCRSGLSAVAGNVGIPSIVLFGPGTTFQYAGVGKTLDFLRAQVPCAPCENGGEFAWNCADNVCMKSISPAQVFDKLKAFL